ncbi:hypothetical protein V8F33_008406 [Rhypophila sp. PSN 637]
MSENHNYYKKEIVLSNKATVGTLPTAATMIDTAVSSAVPHTMSASHGLDMGGGLVNYVATYETKTDMLAVQPQVESYVAKKFWQKDEAEKKRIAAEFNRLSPDYHLVIDNLEQVQGFYENAQLAAFESPSA